MWEMIGALAGLGSLLWSIFSDNKAEAARRAAEEAMWRLFWIAVIVIAVLAFILWRKHRNSTQAIEKPEER